MRNLNSALFLLLSVVSFAYSAPKSVEIKNSTTTVVGANSSQPSSRLKERIKNINTTTSAETKDDDKTIQNLAYKLDSDVDALPIDKDLINSTRDKTLNWRTRYLLLGRIGHAKDKKISKDEEMTLYSDTLLDKQEHDRVRKLAAWFLMEPAKTNAKARQALSLAAKDKTMPGPVLESVMISAGYAGIDDVDALKGLMERDPKTNNEIGINLNAVRALGKSKDPRAIGMLFKIMDESQPDSFYHATALGEFSAILRDPTTEVKIRAMLVPRLLKLLDDRSHYGASRQTAGRLLLRLNETRAIDPIIKWIKPEKDGGGGGTDAVWAAEILAEFGDKRAIVPIEELLNNFATDVRWTELIKRYPMYRFPEEAIDYVHIQECLKKLKGEEYNKSKVMLPLGH
ncbi:MAG: hypothetical protein A2081_06375 [Elusimicrobia bacterium GWC2_61_19]|nr:MAG: hypothetical protein A2081_06375 [Elusimicrobia bacterium GWC2_61_19]